MLFRSKLWHFWFENLESEGSDIFGEFQPLKADVATNRHRAKRRIFVRPHDICLRVRNPSLRATQRSPCSAARCRQKQRDSLGLLRQAADENIDRALRPFFVRRRSEEHTSELQSHMR